MDNITIVNSASVNDSISILGLIVEADFVIYGLEAAIMAKILKLLSKRSISLFASVFIKR
jgi:hypothetical protein